MNIKQILSKFRRSEPENEKTLREIISDSSKKDIISSDEKELIDSIFDLEDTFVEEIMVPRVDMIACQHNTSLDDIIRLINTTSKSRLPVYHYHLDNIIGIVNGNDILKFSMSERPVKAVEIIRPPYFIPETKTVLSTLREFQKNKVSIAIVIDEYGGVAGLITMEDIVEEIVGELQDELDKEEPMLTKLSENTYLVNARMELDEFNEAMGTDFDYENINSVGGIVLSELEHIPTINETLTLENIEFKILEMVKTRIQKIIIKDLRGNND